MASRARDDARVAGAATTERPQGATEAPHDEDGTCSRCGGSWPCLRCLTSTPPYVRIFNSC